MKIDPSVFCRILNAKQRYEWGERYEQGNWFLKQNKTTARVYYRAAAELGHVGAHLKLGGHYLRHSNLLKSKSHYEAAAKLGSSAAFLGLATIFEKQNESHKALQAFVEAALKKESLALTKINEYIQKNNIHAIYALGRIYELQEKWQAALAQYHLAAEQEFVQAMNHLGDFYQNEHPKKNHSPAVPKDLSLTCAWFKKAALLHSKYAFGALVTLSHTHGEAAFTLGSIYEDGSYSGNTIFRDLNVAIKYYQMASEQGYVEGDFRLGYLNELDLLKTTDDALAYYATAAHSGHKQAKDAMDRLTTSNEGKSREPDLSFRIGKCYEKLKEFRQCILHYKSAADKEHKMATQALDLLSKMDGVKAFMIGQQYEKDDLDQALQYYRIAFTKRNADCIEHVKNLAKNEPEAMHCIARYYYVPNNKTQEAVEVLMLAVALKHEASLSYFKSLALSKDLCEKIAVIYEAGNAFHQKNLGLAVIFRIKGLDNRSVENLMHLAGLCETEASQLSEGRKMAWEYYKQAASLKSADATISLERLAKVGSTIRQKDVSTLYRRHSYDHQNVQLWDERANEQEVRKTVSKTYLIDKNVKDASAQNYGLQQPKKNHKMALKTRQLTSAL